MLVREAEAHATQRLDDLGGVLGPQMWHSADDRQPEVARDLFRVPHAGIRAVEQDRAHDAQCEAGQKAHEQQAWRRVLDWTPRHHRRVENPDIRHGGRRGEPGLIVALLERRVRLLLQLGVATQPDIFERPAGNLAQIAGRSVHLSPQFRFPCRQLLREGACERWDRPLLQLRDLFRKPLQRRIRLGGVVPVGAQQRLLVAQLLKRIRQLWRMLHGPDGRQRLRR